MLDVLGFLPRKDLNDDLFISKEWRSIIEGAGKKLPQLLEVDISARYERSDDSFYIANGVKTFLLTEDSEGNAEVLKNCLVKEAVFRTSLGPSGDGNSYESYLKKFMNAINVLGGQPMKIKKFSYLSHPYVNQDTFAFRIFPDFFRDKYSSTFINNQGHYRLQLMFL